MLWQIKEEEPLLVVWVGPTTDDIGSLQLPRVPSHMMDLLPVHLQMLEVPL